MVIRRSPSPERRSSRPVGKASSLLSDRSHTTINAPTTRQSRARDQGQQPEVRSYSDYHRYRKYHNRPPSPPPPTDPAEHVSTRDQSTKAPTTEYATGGFKQNPNPAAAKAYSERSIAGSKPQSRVTFTDSEVTSINGIKVRDERYVTRDVEEVRVDAGDRRVRSDERRRERARGPPSPPEFGHTRGWQ
jgi:hypothetical protein